METTLMESPETLPAFSNPAPGVYRVQHSIVNSYLIGEPGSGEWAVVDAGLANFSANRIIHEAESVYGRGSKPGAIFLTHGHFDHVGAVQSLVRHWQVPVYAHVLELPYLTGRSPYPPPDPTVGGGLMARMARLYPRGPIDLGSHIRVLPEDGVVPDMPGWRWIHTPGHSPGHVSFFRLRDRTLVAGDAFVTTRQESLLSVMTQKQEVHGPPSYYTPDWGAARKSLAMLADLEPEVGATGHGVPMFGEPLRQQLHALVANFDRLVMPKHGRYVAEAATTNADGIVHVPPAVADRFIRVAGAGLAAVAVWFILSRKRHRRATQA